MSLKQQLFAKKSLKVLLDEMAGGHRLRRILGPISLSALGIGAIIGTGIFVLTGLAARNYAGPGLILSYCVAGLACLFAALCYAEFASLAPVAGSAYTYAYTTLGELLAWIIGWDLVLEYAMGSATVANGWAHYFVKFLGLFKDTQTKKALIAIPLWLSMDPFTAAEQYNDYQAANTLVVASATARLADDPRTADDSAPLPHALPLDTHRVEQVKVTFTPESEEVVRKKIGAATDASMGRVRGALESSLQFDATAQPQKKLHDSVAPDLKGGYDAYLATPLVFGSVHLTFNLISICIVTIITVILILGIKESANFNAVMVLVKVGAVLFVIFAGIGYVDSSNWSPFLPFGWAGVLAASGVIFFAYIGFDAVSTYAEEARNPQRDVPIAILASLLICTVLYIVVTAVITGMVPYPQIALDAPIAAAFGTKGLGFAEVIITIGALTGITSVLLVMLLSQPRILLAMSRDGLLPERFFAAIHPRFHTPHRASIITGLFAATTSALLPLEALGHMVSIGTLFAFVVVCAAVWLLRYTDPNTPRPFRAPAISFVAPGGILLCLAMMIYLGWENWVRLFGWMALGLAIYFLYSRHHSHLGKELRGEIATHGISPAGMPLDGSKP
jgi:APA family basic amino acid/polyamine antiporter